MRRIGQALRRSLSGGSPPRKPHPGEIFGLERQSRQALRILTDEPVEPFLSERQLKVWEYANSADTFSRKEVIGATGLHPRTVDHTLRKLVDMNRIERFGQGRATRYRLSGENAD